MNFLSIQRSIDTVNSQTIFDIFGFSVNNSTLAIFLILFFVVFLYFFVIKKFSLRPNKSQVLIEVVYEEIENFIFRIVSNRNKTNMLLPIIGSLFIFIMFSNLISVLPIIGSFTFNGTSIFRAPTADFNTTFALALGCLIIIHFASVKSFGIWGYINRFFKFQDLYFGFKKGIGQGLLSMINFFIGLLDIVGEFAKIVSISLRLFGNIYAAGMVLGTVMTGIVAYIIPSIFTGLGLLFGLVQALVFSALVIVYYMLSMPENSFKEIEDK